MYNLKNRLYLFWNIGRIVYEKEDKQDNIIDKTSKYLSYYFGRSDLFTRQDIKYMKSFYLNFPIYYKTLEKIDWNQYKVLLNIIDKDERYFYFRLSLLYNSNYSEMLEFINNKYFIRI